MRPVPLPQPVRRALVRARSRGRVKLGAGVRLGARVKLEAAPGARILIGEGCRLREATRLHAVAGEIRVGSRTRLGERCVLVALAGIEIGEDCRFDEAVLVVDTDPVYADVETPIRLQGVRSEPVHIGADVVAYRAAVVVRGVSVGEGARIGAHAVVTHDVPAGASVSGTPTRPTPWRSGSPTAP